MISHELKTIFIHIPRTGGTSLETALVGNDWWIIDPDTKHIDWKEAKNLYSDCWDKYLKFTIIRNPWDWIASLYFSHNRGGEISWEDYVRNPFLYDHEQSSMSQCEIIGEEMDFILRYETLNKDFISLSRKLGVKTNLPHVEIGSSTHQHYFETYNDELTEIVAETFKDDIKKFGYKFEVEKITETQGFKYEISALKERIAVLEHDLKLEKQGFLRRVSNMFRQQKS